MDGLLCEGKQLILSRFYLMPLKASYLLFQKAAPCLAEDWNGRSVKARRWDTGSRQMNACIRLTRCLRVYSTGCLSYAPHSGVASPVSSLYHTHLPESQNEKLKSHPCQYNIPEAVQKIKKYLIISCTIHFIDHHRNRLVRSITDLSYSLRSH